MRNTNMINLRWILVILLWGFPLMATAQLFDNKGDKQPYYFNIGAASRGEVFEIYDHLLSFQYDDKYGKSNELPLQIFNWKMEPEATVMLGKVYGANYFNIDLSKIIPVQYDQIYHLRIRNELGHVAEAAFQLMEEVESDMTIDIIVNPLGLKCESPEGNLVEFFGNIQSGRTPYSVNWYVLNGEGTNLLFQPISEEISAPGKTSAIQVDVTPAYYVMLHVVDACGHEQQKMLQLTCSEEEDGINTIFVEPLNQSVVPASDSEK